MVLRFGLRVLLAITICFCGTVFSQSTLVKLQKILPEQTKFAGMALSHETTIDIKAVGSNRGNRSFNATDAWILNADTREVVWELSDAKSSRKSADLRAYEDRLTLERGRYEVYYNNFPTKYWIKKWGILEFFFGEDREKEIPEENVEAYFIELRGDGQPLTTQEVLDYQRELKKRAIVNLTTEQNEAYLKQGIVLKAPTDLIVYCVGEARDGEYDYGWIINAETRETVWRFEDRNSEHAGGAEKNRYVKETIRLPKGRYVAFYVTDDSHAPIGWNAAPPHDPNFWGLTIFLKNEADRKNVETFPYEDVAKDNLIVALVKLGDDEYVSKGFSLKRDTDVRIYAIGEGFGGELFDYGWIEDARTHQRVWEMRYPRTKHAGGNAKNRMADEVIHLAKGDYIVYFVTDDSHSFGGGWNASPPYDRESWGITIIAMDKDFKPSDVGEYVEKADKRIIAQLIRAGNWANLKKNFTLSRDAKVRVYAIGEGRDGEMFDYAWIENADTRKVVWEMTYRMTKHAGGARKNRMVNDVIYLPAGTYILHYESDDSHAYKKWNSDPPFDPEHYGVTLYLADTE